MRGHCARLSGRVTNTSPIVRAEVLIIIEQFAHGRISGMTAATMPNAMTQIIDNRGSHVDLLSRDWSPIRNCVAGPPRGDTALPAHESRPRILALGSGSGVSRKQLELRFTIVNLSLEDNSGDRVCFRCRDHRYGPLDSRAIPRKA